MSLALGIAILVIIVCFIYLYNDYRKVTPANNDSELVGNWIVVIYAVLGGFFAFLLFFILQTMFKAADVQGFIVIATIILSLILCGCTSFIVVTIRNLDVIKKDK